MINEIDGRSGRSVGRGFGRPGAGDALSGRAGEEGGSPPPSRREPAGHIATSFVFEIEAPLSLYSSSTKLQGLWNPH